MSGRMNVPAAQEMRFSPAPGKKSPAVSDAAKATVQRDLLLKERVPVPGLNALTAFRIIIVARFCGAMYSSISDCDEVYNYWEPLHYLWYGKGFQTWEYSPEYAIRSYAYLLTHSLPILIAKYFPNKRAAFFALRLTLGTVSAAVEAIFYRSIANNISPHIARYTLWAFVFSAAFFSAAPSFLPSTFAMWGVMLGSAIAMAPVDGSRRHIVHSSLCFAAAVVIGWPFAVIMAVPVVLEQLFVRGTKEIVPAGQSAAWAANRAQRLSLALICGALVLIPVVAIDSHAYQKLAVVPINIIKYNVFPPVGAGPELYGTSPTSFYLQNALLGFNVLVPLALMSLPAVYLTTLIDPKRFGDLRDRAADQTSPAISLAIRLIPMHIFVIVLTLQEHKEERFLFPAYGHIVLNATTTLYLTRCWLERAYLKYTGSQYKVSRSSLFGNYTLGFMVLTCVLSFARISALFKYYHAPMEIYSTFQSYELPRLALTTFPTLYPLASKVDASAPFAKFSAQLDAADETLELDPLKALNLRLCLGKEWHRFPSHFLVPDEVEVRFIKSAFDGILPKVWDEHPEDEALGRGSTASPGLFGRSTARIPSHMNAHNREEMERYVDISTCHYLIDSHYPLRRDEQHAAEPAYALDSSAWTRVACSPFLDAANSRTLSRVLDLPFISKWQDGLAWGEYCLLRSKSRLP